MLEILEMLAWGGWGLQGVMNDLDQMGFFSLALPFLLIFSVCYAILSKVPVFKDSRGAAVLSAVAIGFLALQFGVVPAFFQTIFPNFGIGLSVLLIALILAGAFIQEDKA
ncbi:MAG: hypothetical protein NT076_00540, partial [Candidatus Pacearchaeota archaeon]|nr:hypothetical protein [Candidatus Pacearchaeota archaeon]